MTITREQVADLWPGDVVELRDEEGWPGAVLRGPLYLEEGDLCIGPLILAKGDGRLRGASSRTLTVVSRAPRPLYVNHPRTEPVPGDVVRDADVPDWNGWIYLRSDGDSWLDTSRGQWSGKGMPKRLRLLVDGETGQVVP